MLHVQFVFGFLVNVCVSMDNLPFGFRIINPHATCFNKELQNKPLPHLYSARLIFTIFPEYASNLSSKQTYIVLLVFNELRLKAVVRLDVIGQIVDHYCLNFFFH